MTSSSLLSAFMLHPHRRALEGHGVTLSYADLRKEASRLAGTLQQESAVAIAMENGPAWVVADIACLMAGVACVPLPPFFTPDQMWHALQTAGVSRVITDNPKLFEGVAKPLSLLDSEYWSVATLHPSVALPKATAKITFTSGSTGTPKGVCLPLSAMETVAESILARLGENISSRHVCLLPLAVLLENVAGVYAALMTGATVAMPKLEYSATGIAQALIATNATSCILMPQLLQTMIASGRRFPHLRFAAVGGAKVAPDMLASAHASGIPVYEGYGLSECASVVALNTPSHHRSGSVGCVLPHCAVRIAADGEILIKDPLFYGYLGQPPFPGGWYPTGDIGRLDNDGFLYVEGRKKHIFITSFGRNISPEWPESLLHAHPAIRYAAVYGEARPYNVAVIVAPDAQKVPQAIADVNARLPDYARISGYIVTPEPFSVENGLLTGNGRVRRDAVFGQYQKEISHLYDHPQEKIA